MKHKHYYLLLLIVATLLVSCPVNQSSPTPSKPDIVVPQEPSAPTTDVEGNVTGDEINAWKDALSALVHCPANGNINNIYQEYRALREVIADTDVGLQDTPNNIPVTYYKGTYVSKNGNNKESNKSTLIAEISGKYKDSGKSFKVYINGSQEYIEAGEASSSTFTGTATYTEGSISQSFDPNKAFSGDQIEDKSSPEYKPSLIMNNMPVAEGLDETKTTFTNYTHPYGGYTFTGKTAGVEIIRNNTSVSDFVSDQEYTDGEVSVTLQDGTKLIVRYDIKREGETKAITNSSYMHVKKEGDEKFKIFPTDQLTL